jgi:phosphatidylglycerophosphatase A
MSSKSPLGLFNFFATGFYSGLAPKAPGTAGTLAAAVVYFLVIRIFGLDPSPAEVALLAFAVFFFGVYIVNQLQRAKFYGPETKDPQRVVIDEFAGYFLTLAGHGNTTSSIALAFVAFRLFDVTKPPPIRKIEKLPLGWGIMADDMFAGVYASMLLYLFNFLF